MFEVDDTTAILGTWSHTFLAIIEAPGVDPNKQRNLEGW